MLLRATLEADVGRKLSNASAADMQRIALAYARIRFPALFDWIDGRAINAQGQTIGGRPDCFVFGPDGACSFVEATRIEVKAKITDRNNEKGHFHDTIAKLGAEGRMPTNFVYVAGHPKIQFSEQELDILKRRVTEAGVASDRIAVVGGDALVDALCEPSMARARIEILGIGEPAQFSLVRKDLGPDARRRFQWSATTSYIPSPEDLAAGTVYFPGLWTKVKERLATDRVCLVRGVGASGKSVLAWLAGLEWAEQLRPSYIADLQYAVADPKARSRACVEELMRLSDPSALFIVDNCHLDEEAAWKIYDAWKGMNSHGSALLFLGRETRTRAGSSILGVDLEPLVLRARSEEVRGVYRRLVSRHLRSLGEEGEPPPPPDAEVDRWVATFGDRLDSSDGTTDLIAFSAAVQGRMAQLLREDWTLTERDAAEEIRVHYLQPLTEEERANLYRLAAFQNLELEVEGSDLPNIVAGFGEACTRLGIVFARSVGRNQRHTRYQLVHASLGRLILAAAGNPVDEIAEYKAVAVENGFAALFLIRRMRAAGMRMEASAVAESVAGNANAFLRLELRYWVGLLKALRQTGNPIREDVVTSLLEPGALESLACMACGIPPHILGHFLTYLEASPLPALNERLLPGLAAELAKPGQLRSLVETALKTPLGDLAHFLPELEASQSPALREGLLPALATELAELARLPGVVEAALKTPPHFLGNLLAYLEKSRVPALKGRLLPALAAELAKPARLPGLMEAASQPTLGNLGSFLASLEKSRLPALKEQLLPALAAQLAKPAHLPSLVEAALKTSPHSLGNLLAYLEKSRFPALKERLLPAFAAELAKPARLPGLMEAAFQSTLGNLGSFLASLEKSRLPALKEQLLPALAAQLAETARLPELVEAALKTPLGDLGHFLAGLERSRLAALEERLLSALAAELARPAHLPGLVECTLKAPPDQLGYFLGTLYRSRLSFMRRLGRAMERRLVVNGTRQAVAKAALMAPRDQLGGLLEFLRNNGNLDPILKEIVASARDDEANALLAQLAEGLVQEAELYAIIDGDLAAGTGRLERIAKVFGNSELSGVRAAVEDAVDLQARLQAIP